MNRSAAKLFLFAAACLLFPLSANAVTLSAPHDASKGYSCASCHITHDSLVVRADNSIYYNNICLNCHRPGDPKAGRKPFSAADAADPFNRFTANSRYQTSHRWSGNATVARAGAQTPTLSAMTSVRTRTNGELACATCHNQHSQTNQLFLRVANDRDQLCFDCHRSRVTRDHATGTHPVNFTYTSATSKVKTNSTQYNNPPVNANPANPTSAMKLVNGALLCSTCHGVHYTDSNSSTFDGFTGFYRLKPGDGNLLRTDLHGTTANAVNICTNCHTGKFAHNRRSQNVQCADCHGAHVDLGDGSKPNIWLVRRQMQFSSSVRSATSRLVNFTSTRKNYKDPSGKGVCQACHDVPIGSGFPAEHASNNASVCNGCHFHGNPTGSFSLSGTGACDSCHGYPPRSNRQGGPVGRAAGSPFTNESTSAHATHALAPYSKQCVECHNGNNHMDANYADVFIQPGPVLSLFTTVIKPQYTAGAANSVMTCSSVYCHSNGNPRNGTLTTRTTPSWDKALGGGKGSINGTPGECSFCHGSTAADLTSNSHAKHLTNFLDCYLCHNTTANPGKSIKSFTLHVNATKDLSFATGALTSGGVNAIVAGQVQCSNLYCHSSVQAADGSLTGVTRNTMTWGGAPVTCDSCHVSMGTSASATGSHVKHAQTAAIACAICHNGAGDGTDRHTNGNIDLIFSGRAAGTAYSQAATTTSNPPGNSYGSCTTSYCHSTVQGAGGSGSPSYRPAITWGATAPCGSCHVNMAIDAAATGSHIAHVQTNGLGCATCHNGAGSGTANHASGQINLAFTGTAASTTYPAKGFNFAPGAGYARCTTSYCHSNGQALLRYSSVKWGGTLNGTCSACHGTATSTGTALLSGRHRSHINNYTTLGRGNSFGCVECHARTVSANTILLADRSRHINTLADYSGSRAGGNASLTGTAGNRSCSATYCHTSGKKTVIPAGAEPAAPTWSGAAMTCKGCHGAQPASAGVTFASVNGEPNYVTGPAGTATANSHEKHVAAIGITSTTQCADCHARTVDQTIAGKLRNFSSLHLNNSRDVAFKLINGKTGTYQPDRSCANTYCHGSASPQWGANGTLNCATCHSANTSGYWSLSSAHRLHWESATILPSKFDNFSGNVSTTAAYRFTCSSCHASGTGKTIHAAGPANANGDAQVFFAYTASGRKAYNYATARTSTDNGYKWTGGGSTSCNTSYCHSNGQSTPVAGTAVNWGTTTGSGNCTICHGNAASNTLSGKHQQHVNNAAVLGTGNDLDCKVCHAKTVDSNTHISDKSKHVNKFADYSGVKAGGSATYSAATKVCSASYCHSNGKGTPVAPPAWNAATTLGCNGCHGLTTTTGAPDYLNGGVGSATANTHDKHVAGAGITATTGCARCHSRTVDAAIDGKLSNISTHLNQKREVSFSSSILGTYNSSNAQCLNTACHGAGNPRWGGAVLACSDCHSGSTATFTNAAATGAHNIHWETDTPAAAYNSAPGNNSSTTQYQFSCSSCHRPGSSAAQHSNLANTAPGSNYANGVGEVFFGYTAPGQNPAYTYAASTAGTDSGTFNWTAGGSTSCRTTYCHSNGQNPATGGTAVTWSMTASAPGTNCGLCHAASPASGKHQQHVNNAAVLGTNYGCIDCHNTTVDTNTHISDKSKHVNKIIDYSGTNAGSFSSATKVCSNVYCHSNGNTDALVYINMTGSKRWNGAATLVCNGCHGRTTTTGAPDYANGGKAAATANSHARHMPYSSASTARIRCNNCHSNTVNAAGTAIVTTNGQKHIDHTIDVIYNLSNPSVGFTWSNDATKSCSAIACHGGTSAQWGDPATCQSCHTGAANVAVFRTNNWNTLRGTVAGKIVYTTYSTTGHGRPALAGNYPGSGNPPAKLGGPRGCEYCHDPSVPHQSASGSNPMRLRNQADTAGWGLNGVCMTCHARGGTTVTIGTLPAVAVQTRISSTHNGTKHASNGGVKTGGQWCWDCHDPHGDTTNIYMIGSNVIKNSNNSAPGQPTVDINSSPPLASATFTAAITGTDYVNTAGAAASTKICQTCHSSTSHYTSGNSDGHNIGLRCTSCHSHNGTTKSNAFTQIAGASHAFPYPGATHRSGLTAGSYGSCTGCHSTVTGYPVARGTAPGCTSCHINAANFNSASAGCADCHGTNADGKPNGNVFPNYSGSHSVHITKAAMTCTNCHFGYGTGSVRHGFSNTSTYSRTKMPKVAFNGVSPVPTWTYTTNTCTNTCHGTAVWGTHLGCIDCHSAPITRTQGRPGTTIAAITTEFGLAWGHKKTGRGAVANADCIVCHLEGNFTSQKPSTVHGDGNIDLRDPDGTGETAITNISGAAFTFQRFSTSYAAGTRTATGHTANTIDNVITQKFCLACHDSNGATNTTARSNNGGTGTALMPFGGLNLGAGYTTLAGAAAAGGLVDAKTQFATANSSVHPVMGPRTKDFPTPARLLQPYNNFTRAGTAGTRTTGIVMNCFDCHNQPTPLLTRRTVAAHGNANTIRGTLYGAATGANSVTSPTFCLACHIGGYNTSTGHGAGSAISTVNSNMSAGRFAPCANCHFSSGSKPARPLQAADVHGFNGMAATGAAWAYGNANGMRPVAFIRNVGRWTTTSPRPASAPGITAGTATCGGNMNTTTGGVSCSENMTTYAPGGSY